MIQFPTSGGCIALVDDNDDDVFMFSRLLRQTGTPHAVLRLSTDEAIDCFRCAALEPIGAPPPALCFLDIKMPGHNGFELLQTLRRNRQFDSMPVVMLSSSDEHRDVLEASALGAQCYLLKYPSSETLNDLIRRAGLFRDPNPIVRLSAFAFPGNLIAGLRDVGTPS